MYKVQGWTSSRTIIWVELEGAENPDCTVIQFSRDAKFLIYDVNWVCDLKIYFKLNTVVRIIKNYSQIKVEIK